MSAVLLPTISPMAGASELIESHNSVSKSNTEIEKDNKVLDDLFQNPKFLTIKIM
ncbi:hypothetical protein ACQKKI_12405 [Staphylococcus capitis]|uniref:hypothetical protein n=1 Tax=Staphylococcus capitis TaxID=29388 RepID=UPI00019293AB|nr:hypothetical protein [Staphylococcus capitis]HBG3423999.1 hypothetical protein [Clostridioides difficile]HEJ8732521.1 hypothetical protein [Staphylococcus aureus]EEE48217.1 hypothetical protein STACA0001_2073 [Staphylococcus capitis SK14]EGS38974.1 hypothetical protein SEVCU116_1407 [Staphylococcus capitis VCU116]MBN6786120.1 hypothetical protein [Staphylococcus capitis]